MNTETHIRLYTRAAAYCASRIKAVSGCSEADRTDYQGQLYEHAIETLNRAYDPRFGRSEESFCVTHMFNEMNSICRAHARHPRPAALDALEEAVLERCTALNAQPDVQALYERLLSMLPGRYRDVVAALYAAGGNALEGYRRYQQLHGGAPWSQATFYRTIVPQVQRVVAETLRELQSHDAR